MKSRTLNKKKTLLVVVTLICLRELATQVTVPNTSAGGSRKCPISNRGPLYQEARDKGQGARDKMSRPRSVLNPDKVERDVKNDTSEAEGVKSTNQIAVIIPYRNRHHHLMQLLNRLHPFLRKQRVNYNIYVVEQLGKDAFNRGMLLNVGFSVSSLEIQADCFFFHDVDLYPEDERNTYECSHQPKHYSVAVDTMNYKLPYPTIVGGVLAMTKDAFLKVNGFSNFYWGWGGEDDDMYIRLEAAGLEVQRPNQDIARYTMFHHEKSNSTNRQILNSFFLTASKRMRYDGLSSLAYTFTSRHVDGLRTHLVVDIGQPPEDPLSLNQYSYWSSLQPNEYIKENIFWWQLQIGFILLSLLVFVVVYSRLLTRRTEHFNVASFVL